MKTFKIEPNIEIYSKAVDFLGAYSFTSKDLVFISGSVYKKHFENGFNGAKVIFHSDYGKGEPSNLLVDAILADVCLADYNRIIAIGGGTIIDVAKLLALKEIQPIVDLFDKNFSAQKERELILVPTTCGTGSEVTNVSILEIVERKTKFGLAVEPLYADTAVLIPELISNLPFSVFATSSIDAFIHAIESYISPKATPFSMMYSKAAMEMIIEGYKKIVENGKDYFREISEDFLIASCYGGIAFGNAGTGAVHAMSYPLSGAYHVAHGEANYVFFTMLFKNYQALEPMGKIKELNLFLSEILGCASSDVYSELELLFSKIIQKKSLSFYGVKKQELQDFTTNVIEKQTRLMANSYVPLSYAQVLKMFEEVYE
ncbi:MAG: 4-hydroxybutyrate dehydrogenase [Lachnospiraceae bacterium]|nr:4-hydroxybutyrate dehydrogenase [Lachnospiraceae bacterium]